MMATWVANFNCQVRGMFAWKLLPPHFTRFASADPTTNQPCLRRVGRRDLS
jgi:hypothetical protein